MPILSTGIPIGVRTQSLRQPLRRAIESAARMGADGVELDLRTELPLADCTASAVREIRKLVGDYNLRVAACAFPTRRGFGDAADLDRRVAAVQQAMQTAYQLGARVVVCRVGKAPSDEQLADDDDVYAERMIDSLTGLGAVAGRTGVTLAAQTGSESGERLAGLIQRLPEGSLGVDFHPAELIRAGHSATEAAETLARWVAYMHAADAVRDFGQKRVVDVELGRGAAELPELLSVFESHDYRGWVTVDTTSQANPIDEAANAVAFLRNL